MNDSDLELYQQLILEHNRKPRNFRKIERPTHFADGYNPLCGDHYQVYVVMGDDGVLQDVSFEGQGCAISKASASIMTDAIKGRPSGEAQKLFDEFRDLLHGQKSDSAHENLPPKLRIFSGIWRYPARVKCAALAWHAMSAALTKQQQVSTE